MHLSIESPAVVRGETGAARSSGARLRLPQIGARTALADVLNLLGYAPAHEGTVHEQQFTNRRVHRRQPLLTAGVPLESLCLVLSGSFRTVLHEADGSHQVIGFPMRGDLIGLDAIGLRRCPVTVSALEEGYVAVIPRVDLIDLTSSCPALLQAIFAASSAGLLDNYEALRTMGALGAEARVTRFLLYLGQHMARFGFSAREFSLTMTRADIASHLGLSVETVSRAFTSLAARGLISVSRKQVRILDRARLDHRAPSEPESLRPREKGHFGAQPSRPAMPVAFD